MKLRFCFLLALALNAVYPAIGASIGDPAPPLYIEKWFKGAPALGQRSNILVVEFWATWCGPCKRSIPHLTAVQQKYKDKGVIVIGVSDEPSKTVAPFVAAQGASMNYYVANDSSRRTFNSWMVPYGANGIPHAFIVDTSGKVVWHDSPTTAMDDALDKIIAGTYDITAARNFESANRLIQQYTKQVSKPNAAASAAPTGEILLTRFTQDWRVPFRLARAIMTGPEVKSRDYPLALRAANKAVEMTNERHHQPLEMKARALYATGQKQQAAEAMKKSISLCKDPEDVAELQKLLAHIEKQ